MSKFVVMKQQDTQISPVLKMGIDLFRGLTGEMPKATPLTGAGSGRSYWRLEVDGGRSLIYTWGKDVEENSVFMKLSEAFRKNGIRVPEILAASEDGHGYLQEDMGREDLLSHLATADRFELSALSLLNLARMQFVPSEEWEHLVGFPPFNRRQVMWDLNYFKYDFLKVTDSTFNEELLEDDFERMATRLISEMPQELYGFMFRDFQSRNVMIRDGEPAFIDFQGGRRGPCLYDAVSFLWQAKAGFEEDERLSLLKIYATEVSDLTGISTEKILEGLPLFVLFRTLQVLGAYGFRGLIEKKAHFIESIPNAIENLRLLMESGVLDEYPELKRVSEQLCSSRYAGQSATEGLQVTVFSFSYKKGYPEDLSGNGGGFMFDCRGMHNPGRYDRFKPMTGLDKEVRDYLEERGEVFGFIDNAFSMVSPTVERYIARGFNSLQIGFGCTGGRHRSVYCAESLSQRLADAFPRASVRVVHREQGIENIKSATI